MLRKRTFREGKTQVISNMDIFSFGLALDWSGSVNECKPHKTLQYSISLDSFETP